jgi:PKD repeat protein
MKNVTRNLLILVATAVLGMVLISCASGRLNSSQPLAPGIQAQLDALQAPDGVDAQLFAQLKDAFERAMSQQDKTVATPPSGPANAPASPGFVDLGGGDYQLIWFYRNIGDYDQSGTVGVTDITPLAVHYGHNGADGIDDVIDVDNNGVGISDVTPIAQHFNVNLNHYEIEWSTAEAGPAWTSMANLPLADGADKAAGWMRFAHTAAFDAGNWYRITPFDASGNPGQSSAAIQTTTISQIPSIVSITPNEGLAGGSTTFNAVVNGIPDEYSWDFGGGATPNTSTDASPTVTLGAIGTYTVSLDVSNGFGSDSYQYLLQVVETGDPPDIVLVTPTDGAEGDSVQFAANVTGGSINTIVWNFGGGATPNISSDASPTVLLGAPGDYSASVTATNSFGDDTYNFTLHVTHAWSFHLIEAGPYVGQQSALCIAEGVPMVAYIQEQDKYIRYARSSVAMPTQTSDWTRSNIEKTQTWGGNVSIAEVDGHAAVLVNEAIAQDAYYFYQNTYPAEAPADWTGCIIDNFAIEVGTLVQDAQLPIPAVSFYDGDMIYAEASSSAPTGPADWFQVAVDTVGFVGSSSQLAIHNENPYLLYRSSTDELLRLAYVNRFDRMNAAAWTIVDVDEGDKVGEWNDLWFEGNDVLIAYTREPIDIQMHFAMGPDDATSMSDFSMMQVEAIGQQDVGQYVSEAVYNGTIGMVYTNQDEINLNFATADYAPGIMPGVWDISTFDDGGGAGAPLINGDTHMLVWNNTLILVYRRNDGLWFCSLPLS